MLDVLMRFTCQLLEPSLENDLYGTLIWNQLNPDFHINQSKHICTAPYVANESETQWFGTINQTD